MTDKSGARIDDNAGPLALSVPEASADYLGFEQMQRHVAMFLANIPDAEQRAEIARLNDEARAAIATTARISMSAGFDALDARDKAAAIAAVQSYDQWALASSVDAERDFGIIYKLANGAWTQATPDSEAIVQIAVWSIDCLDRTHKGPCSRPWDPGAGERVITLMLATEY